VQQHDRIALARFGYVHAQIGQVHETMLDPGELGERTGHRGHLNGRRARRRRSPAAISQHR
jgi:hypothetical protein